MSSSSRTPTLLHHEERPWQRPTTVLRRVGMVGGAALICAVGAQSAFAAPGDHSDATTQANVGVNSSITLAGLTPSFELNGLPAATLSQDNAVSYTVTTNNVGGYVVTVQAAAATLEPTLHIPANTDSIPIGALKVRPHGTGSYTALSNTAAVTLRTLTARSAPGGDGYGDDYQVTIPFVADDVYTATLNYVATAS